MPTRTPACARLVRFALVGTATVAALGVLAAPAGAGSKQSGPSAFRNEVPRAPAGVQLVRGGAVTVTVQRGDSFFAIAQRHGTTPRTVAAANGLTLSTILQPGQELAVPGGLVPNMVPAKLPTELRRVPERLNLIPAFVAAAREFGVPYDVLMSMAYVESGWQRAAVSPVGAVGIGQLMPFTSEFVARDLLKEPKLDARDATDNIRMSARYLAELLRITKGDQYRALAAYYQGHGAVMRSGVSPGGNTYASLILSNRTRFRF